MFIDTPTSSTNASCVVFNGFVTFTFSLSRVIIDFHVRSYRVTVDTVPIRSHVFVYFAVMCRMAYQSMISFGSHAGHFAFNQVHLWLIPSIIDNTDNDKQEGKRDYNSN
jgi:hypothetical protein